ncbi:hypothetical protein K438DRAFT_1785766 [Mycena galopus ATCC 62051]|nr:hypothetical protein K438DRAFT_1785766 [Mycena galopus ATCC 62051]
MYLAHLLHLMGSTCAPFSICLSSVQTRHANLLAFYHDQFTVGSPDNSHPVAPVVESSASRRENAPPKRDFAERGDSALDKARQWRSPRVASGSLYSSLAVFNATPLGIIQSTRWSLHDERASGPSLLKSAKPAAPARSVDALASASTAAPTAPSSEEEEKRMPIKKISDWWASHHSER